VRDKEMGWTPAGVVQLGCGGVGGVAQDIGR
jgi:hypothetical protein